MIIYKLNRNLDGDICSVNSSDGWSIPFDPANTDFQTFKTQINEDTAQLEDTDGVLMTNEEAKQFVSTLP